MFFPDPDFYPYWISDPGSRFQQQQQTRKGKKLLFYLFCRQKIGNKFIFELVMKKIWANLVRILVLFTPKFVIKLSKIWVWDPRSRIRTTVKKRFRIPDPICNTEIKNQRSTIVLRECQLRWEGIEVRGGVCMCQCSTDLGGQLIMAPVGPGCLWPFCLVEVFALLWTDKISFSQAYSQEAKNLKFL